MSTKILPVPRIDVDKLLAIEAAKSEEKSARSAQSAHSKPSVVTEKTEPNSTVSVNITIVYIVSVHLSCVVQS